MRITADQFRKSGFTKVRARRVHRPGEMNKTEAAYDAHLAMRKLAGEIQDYRFEPLSLVIAHGNKTTGTKGRRFNVDFLVVTRESLIELHEVKGGKNVKGKDGAPTKRKPFVEEDAAVKIAVAAETFPFFTFRMVWPGAIKGSWMEQEY